MLILARLLTPADFGVVALVAITLLFFDLMSDAGSQQYLIQKTEVTDSDYNTAWTIDLLMKLILAGVLFICAPNIALFFGEDELTFAIQVIAIVLPIKALKNPKLAQLARDFTYKKLVYLRIVQKLCSFTVVMLVVFIETSYWAIIAGDIAAAIIFTIGSYYIIKYVPKWSLKNIKQQWHFSQWLLLRGIVGFSRGQLDIAFVSKLFGITELGGYHMARELALIPAHNLLIPAIEPLMAAISQSKYDIRKLGYRVRFSLYCTFLAVTPLAVFIWFFSYEIITVILGKQWSGYHPLLKYFSLMFLTFPLFALLGDFLIAMGRVRKLFFFDLATTVVLLITLLASTNLTIELFTLVRCCTSIVITVFLLYEVNRSISFDWKRLAYLVTCIVTVSIVSIVLTSYLVAGISGNEFITLIVSTIVFFIIAVGMYTLVSCTLLKDYEETQHLLRLINELKSGYKKFRN